MTKEFAKWAKKQQVPHESLRRAVEEMDSGNNGAKLGAFLYKKRVGLDGKGKRSSLRTILCMKTNDKAIFMYGFKKNQKSTLTKNETLAFKELAKVLVALGEKELARAIESKELQEVTNEKVDS